MSLYSRLIRLSFVLTLLVRSSLSPSASVLSWINSFFQKPSLELSTLPSTTLRKVFVITRHGDRTPIHFFPNTFDWEFAGELTGEGLHQLYTFGSHLRARYVEKLKFLDSTYNASQLYVQSTNKDRTLMSAHALLTGLYPPGTGPTRADGDAQTKDDPALPYQLQAIPIHADSARHDHLLYAYKNCGPMKDLAKAYRKTEWLAKEKETLAFREKLGACLGQDETVELNKMSSVYHAVKAEIVHGLARLDCIDSQTFAEVEKLKEWSLHRKYPTRRVGQLGSGFLLKHIVETFQNMTEEPSLASSDALFLNLSYPLSHSIVYIASVKPRRLREHRVVYYSSHDSMFLALFSAMGFRHDSYDIPLYASSMLFELHDTASGPRVLFEYNGRQVLLPGCDELYCPLSTFASAMSPGTISESDYLKACGLETIPLKDCLGQPIDKSQTPQLPISTRSFIIGIVAFVIGYFFARYTAPDPREALFTDLFKMKKKIS